MKPQKGVNPFTPEQTAKAVETRRRNAQLRREGKLPPRKRQGQTPAPNDELPEPPDPGEFNKRYDDARRTPKGGGDAELLRWLAYQDGLLQGVVALLDDGVRALYDKGVSVPRSLTKARELLGELL